MEGQVVASDGVACAPAHRGRPREFCVDAALAAALKVFWSKGYEGASLTDLTEAMGITRPSLYAAFGNKEALFRKTLDLYEREKLAWLRTALDAPTAREVVERMWRGALDVQTGSGNPGGCLSVIGSMACSAEAQGVRSEVIARRASSESALLERFERAKAEGDLPPDIDASGLVRYVLALIQGMAVQAGSGVPRACLDGLVRTALRLWPSA